MKVKFNVLDRQYRMYKSEYKEAIERVLDSGWYVLGNEVETFENEFADFTSGKYCVGVNSGLDALTLAFRALGVGKGDEVILPANTHIASSMGITENGATPVPIEPDQYYNIHTGRIEQAITAKTKAILVVHLYGQAANILEIKRLAQKYELFLVEDCAHSHGARFQGAMTGTVGHVGCFSFYPTKILGAFGDAGAIVTNDFRLYEKLLMLRNYGFREKHAHETEGLNSRLDEIQAALLRVNLRHYGELKRKRADMAACYLRRINNPAVKLPEIRHGAEHVWHLFVVRVRNRDDFQRYLLAQGVDVQIHYPVPLHLSVAYKRFGFKKGDYPVAEQFCDSVISLPFFIGMTDAEISYVIDAVNSYGGGSQGNG